MILPYYCFQLVLFSVFETEKSMFPLFFFTIFKYQTLITKYIKALLLNSSSYQFNDNNSVDYYRFPRFFFSLTLYLIFIFYSIFFASLNINLFVKSELTFTKSICETMLKSSEMWHIRNHSFWGMTSQYKSIFKLPGTKKLIL